MYGEVLKNLRIEKGLTQQQLAEILGFKSASAIGMVERQERELSVETIIRITEYFNISSDYLMGLVPFKNETEAYHSISVSSMKYLCGNDYEFPYLLQNYVDFTAVFGNTIDDAIKTYFDDLILDFDDNMPLTDLELFEISNILFQSIKWSPNYNGLIYFQPFNNEYSPFSIKLDFKRLDKRTLDLSKSILVNYKSGNSPFVKYTSILDSSSGQTGNLINEDNASYVTNDRSLKDIELLENFDSPEQALKFILSQPMLAAYGGYDLKNMTDDEIIEIANDMLFAMRLSLEKLKKKSKQP